MGSHHLVHIGSPAAAVFWGSFLLNSATVGFACFDYVRGLSHCLGLALTSEETEALAGGGDGGEGQVAGLGWRGSHTGTQWSLCTSCTWTLLWVQESCLLLPSSPTPPWGRSFHTLHFTGRERMQRGDSRASSGWPAACALDQRTAGMTAALGSHRNGLTALSPPCGQALPCRPVHPFRLWSQTWELSHWRGSVSG